MSVERSVRSQRKDSLTNDYSFINCALQFKAELSELRNGIIIPHGPNGARESLPFTKGACRMKTSHSHGVTGVFYLKVDIFSVFAVRMTFDEWDVFFRKPQESELPVIVGKLEFIVWIGASAK